MLKLHQKVLKLVIAIIHVVLMVQEPVHQDEDVETALDYHFVFLDFFFIFIVLPLEVGSFLDVHVGMIEDIVVILIPIDLGVQLINVGQVVLKGFDRD